MKLTFFPLEEKTIIYKTFLGAAHGDGQRDPKYTKKGRREEVELRKDENRTKQKRKIYP